MLNSAVRRMTPPGVHFRQQADYGGINGFWDYGPLGCELDRANFRDYPYNQGRRSS